MNESNETPKNNSGSEFERQQSAIDQAKNERLKSEGLEGEDLNRPENRSTKTDVSHKKTGGGKQVSPGS